MAINRVDLNFKIDLNHHADAELLHSLKRLILTGQVALQGLAKLAETEQMVRASTRDSIVAGALEAVGPYVRQAALNAVEDKMARERVEVGIEREIASRSRTVAPEPVSEPMERLAATMNDLEGVDLADLDDCADDDAEVDNDSDWMTIQEFSDATGHTYQALHKRIMATKPRHPLRTKQVPYGRRTRNLIHRDEVSENIKTVSDKEETK